MIWASVPFETLYSAESRNGLTRPKRVRGTGFKMVNMGEVFAYDRISDQDMECVPLSPAEIEKFSIRQGDLLFARQSLVLEGAGKCSIVLTVPEITTFESHLIRVRLDQRKADPHFYFNYFRSRIGKGRIASLVTQVAAAGIRGSELAKLRVPSPPIEKQHRISEILSAYDDLIENNARRIKILGEMAQMLYREWFVHFRFPGHEKVRMIESELGPIPEGWSVKSLEDVAKVNELKIKENTAIKQIRYIDIASVSTGKIENIQLMDLSSAPGRARRIVRHGDIIWSTVRPNRRSYALILKPEPHLIVSTGFAVLTAAAVPFSYLYAAIITDAFAEYLTSHATGSAYPAVTGKEFEKATLLIPGTRQLKQFHDTVEPMLVLAHCLDQQNANLRATRDLLLPKLISGEIPVEAADDAAAQLLEEIAQPA